MPQISVHLAVRRNLHCWLLPFALSACQTIAPASDTAPSAPPVPAPKDVTPVPDAAATPVPAAPPSPSAGGRRAQQAQPVIVAGPTGQLAHAALIEVSGLANSSRNPDVLWMINDSGNAAVIYAVANNGELISQIPVATKNRDWEALESVWLNGDAYLLIAETGDNLRSKRSSSIVFIREPELDYTSAPAHAVSTNGDGNNNSTSFISKTDNSEPAIPLLTMHFRFPDGPHNSEAMGVSDNWLYLLSKEPLTSAGQMVAARVYRLPLPEDAVSTGTSNDNSTSNNSITAEFVAELALPARTLEARLAAALANLDLGQPTALDFDASGHNAYVLTYRDVLRYSRNDNQTWAEAFALQPQRIESHELKQAEALGVDDNGVIWFTSEKTQAPIWAIPAPR